MRLNQILDEKARRRLVEGGNAFAGVGTIHIDEIGPTLGKIQQQTKLSDVESRVLGSVGKKEYSGDMDIAVEPKSPEELATFIASLEAAYGKDNVRKVGPLVTTKVPIEKYNPENNARPARTGYVQVDYMFGNPEWLKTYYHSPRDSESKFKGAHRNLAIAAVVRHLDTKESSERDGFDRPVETERWIFSPKDGLIRVKRTSRKGRGDKWIKGQKTEKLSDPIHDADEIAKVMFRSKAGKEALNSLESIMTGVTLAYTPEEQKNIFATMAANFKDTGLTNYEFPEEIGQYL